MPARSTTQTGLKSPDEKITINIGCVDLGQIDLLVAEGFYSNRTDLIRTAIRNQLVAHEPELQSVVARKMLVLGIQHYTAADLKQHRASGQKLDIKVLGLASFADDVTPALVLDVVNSISVLGAIHAAPAVKAALAKRMAARP